MAGVSEITAAAAIENKDAKFLVALPEIGKRTAETIIVELSGKVDRFVELKPTSDGIATDIELELRRDAASVLVQLGESAISARLLVERASSVLDSVSSADELVTAALRLREG